LFSNKYDPERILLRYRPVLAYIPVDGHNQPPGWDVLAKVTNRVAMSRFGQEQMPESKLVYHGIDTDKYWPVSSQRPITTSAETVLKTKADCKAAFGYPRDSFLVLRVDRNSGRKDFPATWKALVPVMQKHTDIIVHFHCQGQNDMHGVDLVAMFSRDPATKDRFYLPDFQDTFIGWTTEDMNALYNAADLFVTTSRGEGFGLTIAEALSCGVPVIAQNVTAIPEVVGPGGVLLEPQREITVPSGQDLWLADVGAFTEAIEHLYVAGGIRRKLGLAGWEHVTKSFSWDFAAARFNEYITALANGASDTGEEVLAHGAADADSRNP
jgi:glycosyltransferase involved in cell wall biosynthesis